MSFLFSNLCDFFWNIFIVLCVNLSLTVVILLHFLHFLKNIFCAVVCIRYKFGLALQTASGLTLLLADSFLTVLFQGFFFSWWFPIHFSSCKSGDCGSLFFFLFRGELFLFRLYAVSRSDWGVVALSWASCSIVNYRNILSLVRGNYWSYWRFELIWFPLSCWSTANVYVWSRLQ